MQLIWRFFVLVLLAVPMLAKSVDSTTASPSDAFRDDFGETDYIEERWREQRLVLPAPPQKSNLVEVVEIKDLDFRYFVDSASLGLGADRVTRLSLVSRSQSGYDNVEYIGVHCADEKVRRYAYLDSYDNWQLYPQRDWDTPHEQNLIALTQYFLCDHLQPKPTKAILQSLGEEGGELHEFFSY